MPGDNDNKDDEEWKQRIDFDTHEETVDFGSESESNYESTSKVSVDLTADDDIERLRKK